MNTDPCGCTFDDVTGLPIDPCDEHVVKALDLVIDRTEEKLHSAFVAVGALRVKHDRLLAAAKAVLERVDRTPNSFSAARIYSDVEELLAAAVAECEAPPPEINNPEGGNALPTDRRTQ